MGKIGGRGQNRYSIECLASTCAYIETHLTRLPFKLIIKSNHKYNTLHRRYTMWILIVRNRIHDILVRLHFAKMKTAILDNKISLTPLLSLFFFTPVLFHANTTSTCTRSMQYFNFSYSLYRSQFSNLFVSL